MAASSKSTSIKVQALQQDMVKKIGNKTLKEHVHVLKEKIGLLEANLALLNSILKKDLSLPNSAQLLSDLKRCDIELQENDLEKYDIELQEDDIDDLTKDLIAYNTQLKELREQLENCGSGKKELIEQEINDIENKKLILELKICNNKLRFYNNELNQLLQCAWVNQGDVNEEIDTINEAKHSFELKKCILEIKICNANLERYKHDLEDCYTSRDNGPYEAAVYHRLSQKISAIDLGIDRIEAKKRTHQLNQCSHELNQCSLELNSFNNMLLREAKHILDNLHKNAGFKQLILYANQVLAKFLLTPQIFNPKIIELLQPLVDLLYCFNKVDFSIATILQAFEKIKQVVATRGELCQSEWDTFSDSIIYFANDNDVRRDFFNNKVEKTLQGVMVKEIVNELSQRAAENKKLFDRAGIEKIFGRLVGIEVLNESEFKKILKELKDKGILNESEFLDLEVILKKLFSQRDKKESLSNDAKRIILCGLNEKYLGALKETYFVTFFIFKLIKLEMQKDEKGLVLHENCAIPKVENCISYLMGQYLPKKSDTPYYSARVNPENDALEESAKQLTIEIMTQVNYNKPVLIAESPDTPQTYINKLEECKDNGAVNIEKLFLALFADYNRGGLFLHPFRHHKDRVNKVLACVEKNEKQGEFIDWHGVLKALETWPDNEDLANQGSLKKRIHFFREVMRQIDGIQEVLSVSPSAKR